MEIVNAIAATIVECLVAPIGHQLGYLLCYSRNIEDFRNQVQNLETEKVGVQGLVDAAERNGQVILLNVQTWLTSVDEITRESRIFFDEELQVNKRCFNGPFPNLKLRYQRSRKAKKKTAVVDELKRNRSGFGTAVSHPAPPRRIRSTCNEDAEAFESRELILKQVMEALKGDKINMIGICGMGGVGKTTLVKEVSKRAEDDMLFDEIVMAVVSQTPVLERIQDEIAEMLGLQFDEKTVSGRARRLFARLEKKRILVILDDVWDTVNLEAIGVPFGAKHKGSKTVLTSRSLDVCIQMDAEKNFLLEVLSKEEGWNLFRKMAGDTVDSPDRHNVAVEVAGECGGLPVAIVAVARALKGKHLPEWRDARNKLRKSIPSEKVISCLELSYNHLGSDEAKSFFLLCCLYPEDWDIEIRDLMKYGMGMGLFKNVQTVDEARDRAHTLAYFLKSSCLLLEGSHEERVKMHDVIRDVGITIASKVEHCFLERAGLGWKEWPKNDTYKRCTAISLSSNDNHELPDERECPELRILVLNCRHPSLQFPKNFFLRMENLNVLDMSSMNFLSLPPSLRYLKNLRTLCLHFCIFEDTDLSIIGELEKLEILSLCGSNIKQLPKKIGILAHLRLLDLTGCDELAMIPPDVIRDLSRLEELYMKGSFDMWEFERRDTERSNASLKELKDLSCLVNLEIQISDADLLPEDLLFENLSRFNIRVGTSFEGSDQSSNSKILELGLDVSTGLKDGIKVLLTKVEDLRLRKLKGLKSVVYDLDREGFQNLRHLIVKECGGLEYIFNASVGDSLVAFPILEKMDLKDLEDLKEICNGRLPNQFFSKLQELRLIDLPELKKLWKDPAQHVCLHNLTVVKVEECGGLKNLFSHSEAKGLSKLVELEVRECRMMEEIVGNEKEAASAAVDDIVFHHLRYLKLGDLPNLKNFCSKMMGDPDTSTEEPLFDKKVSFPQLKVLIVKGCHKVSKVIQFNMISSLEELNVQDCDSLEEVVEVEGLVVETLNQLRELNLGFLPKLKHIMRCDKYPHRILGFQNLSSIDIYYCNSLKSLFSPSMANCLAQLKEVEINSCQMMESIITEEREGEENWKEIVFPQLHTFKLLNLPKLISFMKTTQQKLRINGEMIVKESPQEGNLPDPIQPLFDQKVAFPVLETLKIEKIGNLIEIWHSQFPVKSFSQLKVLKVRDCHKVSKIVAFNLLKRLLSLEELSIKNCDSVEEIIGVEGLVVEEGHLRETLSQLKKLKLRGLPKLKHIMRWDMYPHRILGFRNLSSINIFECHSLASLFSPSMASNLVQLQELEIDLCEMMESIIAEERQGEDCIKIVEFPELSTLQLKNLRKLISFRQTFTSNFSVRTTQEGNLGDPIQPLFDKKVSFPQLKVLNVEGCHKVSKFVQFNLLLSLEELNVKECYSLEEIVEVEVEGLVVFPQLRLLKLENLPKLISFMKTIQQKLMIKDEIVKEAPQEGNLPDPIQPLFDKKVTLPTIEVLKIKGLDKLEDIWHPQFQAKSFCQLKVLEVESCQRISNVIPSNLLKHLTNLEEVSVENCDSVEIIFEVEWLSVENRHGTMTLSQLRKLSLSGLPKLFTSKHPILQKLQMDDEESKEKPDESNSCITIRPLFDEWVAFTNLVELQIVNIENLQEIFHSRLADESFSQLRILKVKKCHKLSRVAPSNLLPRLQNLERLIVKGCNSMEKIFELEGEGRTPISLSQLEFVKLHYLPSLLMFCSGKCDFELPSLETFRFSSCPKMQTFSDGLKSTPNLKGVYPELSEKVWKGDLNSTIHHLVQEEEIKQCLYVIKDLVHGLHSREQESSVQEDEEKDKDEEVGEKSEEANVEEQERKENISAQAVHHEISEEAEQEGHRKGSMEAIREHLKVMTNLLDELGVGEEEDDEEEGESEKAREANIEELQEISEHLETLVVYRGDLHKPERVVVIRKHLKRMMDLVDGFGLREQELSIISVPH